MPASPLAYLGNLRPVPVGPVVPQTDGIGWLQDALSRAAEEGAVDARDADRARRIYGRLQKASAIDARATGLDDYTHADWDRMRLYQSVGGDGQAAPGSAWYRPTLQARMAVFSEVANRAAEQAFDADEAAPGHLIQVSCTGYDAPTAAQRVALSRGWEAESRLLHLGHMGCYAAVPATATAADLVQASPDAAARASVFHVELCTLHLDPTATEPSLLVQQALFADGAIRYDLSKRPQDGGFALLGHFERLLPETREHMTWRLADSAFDMVLSRDLPRIIRKGVGPVVEGFLAQHGLTPADVPHFAIHPGGPSVIESTAEALGIGEDRVPHSQAVLRERGNMSSATLPHIWKKMTEDPAVKEGDLICSIAFGPGLTVTGNLLRRGR
jgi:predicted naringenin-chalcone synthase